jgi:hypothetical protein
MLNFTKILPVEAALIHADGQRNERNEGNRRFFGVWEKGLKTVQILGKGRTDKNIKQVLVDFVTYHTRNRIH